MATEGNAGFNDDVFSNRRRHHAGGGAFFAGAHGECQAIEQYGGVARVGLAADNRIRERQMVHSQFTGHRGPAVRVINRDFAYLHVDAEQVGTLAQHACVGYDDVRVVRVSRGNAQTQFGADAGRVAGRYQ